MTMANTFAAKLSVAFVAIAMALSMVAPAQAQTAEELQAQIDTLMATIASLQGQLGVSTPVATGNAYVFTRDLTIGSTGADVTALQNYLIGAGFSIPAGATGYFGSQTQAAVAAWQTANGVMPAAGYFGPVSQAKYTALVAVSTPTTPDDEDEDEDEDDEDTVSLSGEASLGDVELSDGDDTEVEEGQETAPVAEFEVEFDNGDAEISRLDLTFTATGEEDAWDTFEEVSLWVDGDEVASMMVDDEDNWLSDEETIRMSGLDIVAMEDEPLTITVAVTVQGSVDTLPATWNVDVTEIRYVDADDVTSTDDVTVDSVDFEVREAGADDELTIKSSSEDPEATTLQVEDDTNSDWLTVFIYNLDSDDSTNDIELNDVVVSLLTGTADVEDVVNDVKLVIDGEEFDDFDWTDADTDAAELTFDIDGDYAIEAGEEVAVEVMVEFKKADGVNYSAGETIQATTTDTLYTAEGADDVDVEGSATGETHTLRAEGIALEAGETDADTQGDTDATGIFTIEFDVTAFENDFYIAENATSTNDDADGGVYFSVEGPNGFSATSSGVLSSTADEDTTGVFTVREGETETFTLTVTVDTTTTGQHRVLLNDVWFTANSNGVASIQTDPANPAQDYRTGYVNVNAN